METLSERVLQATKYINSIVDIKPDIGIILGSGLGSLAYEIQDPVEILYNDIPYFLSSTAPGHEGKLVFGKIYDKNVVVMQGRVHFYEGYSLEEVAFPVRVMAFLGISALIVTNAAGGINPRFKPGDLMLITDHINFSALSPLRGPNDDLLGPRFPSMGNVYDKAFLNLAKETANELKINIQEGVYAFMPGPQYETNAEVKMLSTLGASAVGMSTVPEVIAAAHSGISVLGISCITNMAGSSELEEISHNSVLEEASKAEVNFKALVLDTIRKIS